MEHMQTEDQSFSPKTQGIADRFAGESRRAAMTDPDRLGPPMNRAPVDMGDYKQACAEMLGGNELLSDKILAKRIAYLMQDSKMKLHFPEGYRCCLAVIPFSNLGNPLSMEEINNGDHLCTFVINKEGKTVSGFNGNASYVGDFLPTEVKNAAFVIGKYENGSPFDVTDNDRKALVVQYSESFRKLQALLGQQKK